jgi:hypothetical protein
MKTKLNNCPFCGSNRLRIHDGMYAHVYISCISCRSQGPFIAHPQVFPMKKKYEKYKTYKEQLAAFEKDLLTEAIKKWNSRNVVKEDSVKSKSRWICQWENGQYMKRSKKGVTMSTSNKNEAFDFGSRQAAREYKYYIRNMFSENMKVIQDPNNSPGNNCVICYGTGFTNQLTKTPCPKCGEKE